MLERDNSFGGFDPAAENKAARLCLCFYCHAELEAI